MPSTPPIFSSYAAFSAFISSDTELSLYRTFHALSSRNLLYLQSSLLGLENRLKELDEEDLKGLNINNFFSAKCWETFSDRAKEHPREAERMELIMMIKKQIKEYHEALLLQSEVLKFSKPSKRVFRVFQGWFESEKPFVGYGNELLQQRDDFVALKPSPDQDFLARFLQDLGGRCLLGTRHTTSKEVKYYSSTLVSRLATIVTVLAASLVIEGAIVALYIVQNQHVRLGLIALFTSIFAASLAVMTDGRRTDIILATAACAAVLVVFVSQSSGVGPRTTS
ncbi:uncharacterized protein K444DRAFT_664437 [Hyaloscypha bicolor E]|uniref:DUF6594 domain-containing protein n=1 Tax=Hyaloscypha bicolor E TaxID=1095630 RepID=A0A2J6T5M9_9HELO|nr:uncharacterized protein K444DRAFT_664437 [Hyaloscypha bicolor E]PMD58331.1 hypothetical protein K444DRAFT_664437 [Hyaloscypha bicolor E]